MDNKLKKETVHLQSQLKMKKTGNFIKKFLTLGMVNNDKEIQEFEEILNRHKILEKRYAESLENRIALDKEWGEVEQINGIRISKNTFADFKVINADGYPADWEDLRKEILQRDNYRCQEGNEECNGPLQIHHIIPLSRGGSNDPDNLITLCYYHHSLKHDHMRKY